MSIFKKKCKLIGSVFAIFCICLYGFNIEVQAAINYKDAEPNNTVEQAQQIIRNQETLAQYADYDSSQYRGVFGTLIGTDVDWYSVDLSEQEDVYFNVRKGISFSIDIYDSNHKLVETIQCKNTDSTSTHKINIVEGGVYYLRLSQTFETLEQDYSFTIGNPPTARGEYVHKFDTRNLGPRETWSDGFDLKGELSIPDGAVAYRIHVGGLRGSATSSKAFKNDNSSWMRTNIIGFVEFPATNSFLMKQSWYARIISSDFQSNTIEPTLSIEYVYYDIS